ncbi:MAG: hypothetical protein AB9921_10960 [Erysipelotrichaceae bacterium]
MAYLHTGDNQATTSFSYYPCETESVYITGLKSDEMLLSSSPYFQQNADGYLAIDDRFMTLYIMKDGSLTQRFDLQWKTGCATQSIVEQTPGQQLKQSFPSQPWLTVIAAGILTILVARMVFHEKN